MAMNRMMSGAMALAMVVGLVACDKHAQLCKSGEGLTPDVQWGECNASCISKDNAESCAAAKQLSPSVCQYTVQKQKVNQSACAQACAAGDQASCAYK